MSATPTIIDQWSDGKRLHIIGTIDLASTYTAGGDTLDLGAAGARSSRPPNWIDIPAFGQFDFGYFPGNLITNGRLVVRLKSAQAATGTITSDGTNVIADETVTVGASIYTFKASVASTANQVLIGVSAAASILNLLNAINANPEFSGLTFGSATVPNVTEYAPPIADGGLVITVVARKGGTASNSDALEETSAHLSVSGATLASGAAVNANPGELTAGTYPADALVFAIPFYAIVDQYI